MVKFNPAFRVRRAAFCSFAGSTTDVNKFINKYLLLQRFFGNLYIYGHPYCSFVRGVVGAFLLGLAYGILSGSCTFGFIAPILAIITIQQKVATGILFVVLFGIGHCIPIAVAGSSAALVRRVLENSQFQQSGIWFRRIAGVAIAGLGIYFIMQPF